MTIVARLPDNLLHRLQAHPQTGNGYWTVVVRLWDGREIRGVAIIDGDIVQTIDRTPIQPAEIVNLGMDTGEWLFSEGARGS